MCPCACSQCRGYSLVGMYQEAVSAVSACVLALHASIPVRCQSASGIAGSVYLCVFTVPGTFLGWDVSGGCGNNPFPVAPAGTYQFTIRDNDFFTIAGTLAHTTTWLHHPHALPVRTSRHAAAGTHWPLGCECLVSCVCVLYLPVSCIC